MYLEIYPNNDLRPLHSYTLHKEEYQHLKLVPPFKCYTKYLQLKLCCVIEINLCIGKQLSHNQKLKAQ